MNQWDIDVAKLRESEEEYQVNICSFTILIQSLSKVLDTPLEIL
jgi:hypothetical protein